MPLEITFNPGNLSDMGKAFKRTRDNFSDTITEEFESLGPTLAGNLEATTPIGATGRLALSTGFRVIQSTNVVSLEIIQAARSLAFGNTPPLTYRPFVSKGRRPGKRPPSQALERWVQIKLGLGTKLIKRVAYLIARDIGRFGTPENIYILQAFNNSRNDIQRASNRLGTRIITQLLDF